MDTNRSLEQLVYPKTSRQKLNKEFYKLKELCCSGIDFIHKNDILTLQTIIVKDEFVNLCLKSSRGFFLNERPTTILNNWHLIHFNEAIQDKEISPLVFLDIDNVDYELIKLFLLRD